MSNFEYNILSPVSKKEKTFKSYNNNQYRSIDSASNRSLNRPLNNKIEYDTPLSSISNNNYIVHNKILPKYNYKSNEDQEQLDDLNIFDYQDFQIKYLENKLNYFNNTNTELNRQFKEISEKSKLLISKINNNNKIFAETKKNYEESLKKNKELKQKYNILLQQYKDENVQNEATNKLQKEQKMLLLTIKSKENTIKNLQDTLNILKNETEEEKNKILNDSQIKRNKINELKKVLNELCAKIENNKNNISFLNKKKEELIKKKNSLINNNIKNINEKNENENKRYKNLNQLNDKKEKYIKTIEEYEKILKDKNEILNKKIKAKRNTNYYYKIKPEENQLRDDKYNSDRNFVYEQSFGPSSLVMNKSEKLNQNQILMRYNNYYENSDSNLNDNNDNINEFAMSEYHKKNQSAELDDNYNQLLLNYIEKINPSIANYTIPSEIEDEINHKKLNSYKNNIKRKNSNSNNNNIKNMPCLFSITKEGKLIEFNIVKKIYTTINTSKIAEWDSFILEYLNYSDGSLFLNTFQGLFIVTGKNNSDLYYYSKKYNSISKMKAFNYNHKYGALILSPNNETLLIIGGETKNVEKLYFEKDLINSLPPLLTQRINSTFTFIGNKLFGFFGKNNDTIEYLDMNLNKKWELINYKINIDNYKKINLEGNASISMNNNEILIIGGNQYNKMITFNAKDNMIDLSDIQIPFPDKFGDYRFDKDKYFNSYIGNDKYEINNKYLSQLIGIDLKGNIHYFNKDFSYSVILFEKNYTK